eukprot:TRINITY_DN753_c0_g1_i1.p1 TRINITY_DN753_c0_g1~~TRINITY_DN753_c0_g1_i1.p1  ORF type:complete len:476 (+),score=147.78 TRINITY_DN753_c0_g1_i1:137-1564(+)
MDPQSATTPEIILTEHEEELIRVLREVSTEIIPQPVLRIAGGWVRDKLLGKHSVDIDIALDGIRGVDFANRVRDYLIAHGMEAHSVGTIKANPEQSKHLETATTFVLGYQIDFCHLRSETYTEESRIPQVEMGTVEEDAFRRDFTINAMYYNIHSGKVEDVTKHGWMHLLRGVIQTPCAPLVTLLDDPLRALRGIRFASRLRYEMVPELIEAAHDPRVSEALGCKISRERVGKEFEGMLSCGDFALVCHHIMRMNLWNEIFALPTDMIGEFDAAAFPSMCLPVAAAIQRVYSDASLREKTAIDSESFRLAMLAAVMKPLLGLHVLNLKGKRIEVMEYVMRESLKMRVKDIESVINVASHAGKCHDIVHQFLANGSLPRRETGFFIRSLKREWKSAWLLDLGIAIASLMGAISIEQLSMCSSCFPFESPEEINVIESYVGLLDAINDGKMGNVFELKPLINVCRNYLNMHPVADGH